MNRRALYLVIALVVVAVLFKIYAGTENKLAGPPQLSAMEIRDDFVDLSDNKLPVEPVLGGTFFTTALMYPEGFEGRAGDRFYAVVEDGHVLYTLEYELVEKEVDGEKKLDYKLISQEEDVVTPDEPYEEWKLVGDKLVKQNPSSPGEQMQDG